jgi:hypothetical protein
LPPAIWQNTGLARLLLVVTDSYTSSRSGEGSYDNPFAGTADGSWSISHTETDYDGSYNKKTGAINRDHPPIIHINTNLSFDKLHTYTHDQISQWQPQSTNQLLSLSTYLCFASWALAVGGVERFGLAWEELEAAEIGGEAWGHDLVYWGVGHAGG